MSASLDSGTPWPSSVRVCRRQGDAVCGSLGDRSLGPHGCRNRQGSPASGFSGILSVGAALSATGSFITTEHLDKGVCVSAACLHMSLCTLPLLSAYTHKQNQSGGGGLSNAQK